MNYKLIYDNLINRAKCRKITCYTENHHIIPKCIGGTNDKENLVRLTAQEHFLAHKLLVEVYPNERGLKSAIWMMSSTGRQGTIKGTYKVGAREYQRLRENASGPNHHMFGKHENFEERYGKERAIKIRKKMSKSLSGIPSKQMFGKDNNMHGRSVMTSWIEKYGNVIAGQKYKEWSIKLSGRTPTNKNNRTVLQYDCDNNLLKTYKGLADVIEQNPSFSKSNISAVISGRRKTAYSFIWA